MFSRRTEQVTLTVAKLAGTNAVFVAKDVEKVLEEHREELDKEGIEYVITRDYGERANEAVFELSSSLSNYYWYYCGYVIFALGFKESIIVTFTVPANFGSNTLLSLGLVGRLSTELLYLHSYYLLDF